MTRREARELILQTLFEVTFHEAEERVELINNRTESLKGKMKAFVVEEIEGVLENEEQLDTILEGYLKNWSLSRIAKIDYILLKMAVYEMQYIEDIPNKVAINEVIELAKIYSTDKSPRFIHGVLGQVLKNLPTKEEVVKVDEPEVLEVI